MDMLIISLSTQAANVNLAVGSHVWVKDSEEAWIDGEVVGVNDEEIEINCTSGKTVSAAFVFQILLSLASAFVSCIIANI